MAILLCGQYPALKIHIPGTGAYREFQGGKLEIDADDPDYPVVMAEASRNPSIVVYESVTTCPHCGEAFAGKAAAPQLGKHVKDAHFEKWLEDQDQKAAVKRNAEVKAREGIACDICPHATFASADELAIHTKVVHTAAPAMDDEGNETGGSNAAAGGVQGIPAAKPTA